MTNSTEGIETPTPMYCTYHPKVKTLLRCSKCGKPICIKCAVSTPVGYKCRDCLKTQQQKFNTAKWFDYPLGFIIAFIISLIISLYVERVGFLVIFIAPVIGRIISWIVHFTTRKRRSGGLFKTIAAGAFLGTVPILIAALSITLDAAKSGPAVLADSLLTLFWLILFAILVTTTIYHYFTHLSIR